MLSTRPLLVLLICSGTLLACRLDPSSPAEDGRPFPEIRGRWVLSVEDLIPLIWPDTLQGSCEVQDFEMTINEVVDGSGTQDKEVQGSYTAFEISCSELEAPSDTIFGGSEAVVEVPGTSWAGGADYSCFGLFCTGVWQFRLDGDGFSLIFRLDTDIGQASVFDGTFFYIGAHEDEWSLFPGAVFEGRTVLGGPFRAFRR